ncbi:CRISPR-associated protein, Csd1-type, partial [mine drainage metagenome]
RESTSIAYHCGRLLAVFEQIQSKALPNVKAGVVQRFYGAASTTPGLVMGRLFRTAQHHIGSIENPTYYQKLLGEVTEKIGASFPPVLSLEEQGRFALGYYHQRSERFAGNK